MALKLVSNLLKVRNISLYNSNLFVPCQEILNNQFQNFHTTDINLKVSKWHDQNEWIYPPQKSDEPRRPAFVNHVREGIKYSPKKMWYVACLVRGMSVDEAIKQLSFVPLKGALIAKEVIKEAQEMAVKEHNVEYKSNLWVAESYVGKDIVIKGIRKHAKMRIGVVHYRYCKYFVRLVEGCPPEHYYTPELTGNEKLEAYFKELRIRRIHRTL